MTVFKQVFVKRWLRWLDKRIPPSTTHTLTMQSIFVLPTTFGWGFLLTALCLFLLGTNYQNNLMLLLSYSLLSIELLVLFHSYLNFAQLTLSIRKPTNPYMNELTFIPFTVLPQHKKDKVNGAGILHFSWLADHRGGVRSAVEKGYPPQWQANKLTEKPTTTRLDLDKQDYEFSVPILPTQRGRFALPRLTCVSVYPLGLFRCWTHLDFAQHLIVYPAPMKAHAHHGYDGNKHAGNTDVVGNEDFFALNSYKEGEPLNRVAWKQVAKNGQWVSKEFSEQRGQAPLLTLNTALPLETALSHLSYQITTLHQQQQSYGLALGNTVIQPGNSQAHKTQCLSALALYRQAHY